MRSEIHDIRLGLKLFGALLFAAAFCLFTPAVQFGFRTPLVLIGLLAVVLLCSQLRDRAWILIPVGWAFSEAGGSYAIRPLYVLLAAVASIFWNFRGPTRRQFLIGWLELALLPVLTCVVLAYLRRPVGINGLDASFVGGNRTSTFF